MGKKSKRRQHKNKNRNRNSRRGGSVSGEDSSSVTTTTSASVSASTKQYPQEDPVPVVAADNDNEDEENETENEDDEKLPSFTKAKIWSTLTEGQKMFVLSLNEASQSHLFESWTESDNVKDQLSLVEQLKRMDDGSKSRGGILGYISNAKKLLAASKAGLNPLEGYVPSVPTYGDRYELGTVEYMNMEGAGIVEVGSCGFVLVAGGLGERLGYSGIKLGLPTEMATETCYLQYYIEMILAIQGRYGEGKLLPLCIMVSNDTCPGTMKLLEANNYFGMEKTQITIVQQGDGVPALMDNDARIALDPNDPNKILAKPHGHGDIHALMFDHKVAEEWSKNGIRWAIFCQDTNGLAFHTLPLALGVSKRYNLIMNCIAVPRKAKQAIGAITKLVNTTTKNQRTINVEYNQLDPLLRATTYPEGDVNDETTGYSPFPGNINQLVFDLKHYNKVLQRTQGAMPEFVNPKYKDEAKTTFKKPTRLECMMQDFPTVLEGDESAMVGFTSVAADFCFSPVKNATADGAKLQEKGTHPGVAATGEAEQYGAVAKILRMIGCSVGTPEPVVFKGISFIPGPELVFKPSFVAFSFEYPKHFPIPADISISSRSSLVINNGDGLTIESLDLDGALVINCEEGVKQVIKGLKVCNKGWIKEKVSDDSRVDEIIKMRGYRIKKLETRTMTYKADGTIIDSDSAPAISISPKTVEKESPQCLSKLQGPENEDDGTDKCQCTIQ